MLSQVFIGRDRGYFICFLYRNKAIQVSFSYISLCYHLKSLQLLESLPFNFTERDVIADANILQGAIFHEDAAEESDGHVATESDKGENQSGKEYMWNPLESRSKQMKSKYKPAAHRVNKIVFHLIFF